MPVTRITRLTTPLGLLFGDYRGHRGRAVVITNKGEEMTSNEEMYKERLNGYRDAFDSVVNSFDSLQRSIWIIAVSTFTLGVALTTALFLIFY